MSKSNGWIKLDKNFAQELPNDRPYTKLEAVFSHAKDLDEGKPYTVNGYAKQWQWSRNKVRKFLNDIRTPEGHPIGHFRDTGGTSGGHNGHLIINGLQEWKDTIRTPEGHRRDTPKDTGEDTTIKTKTKRKTKTKEKDTKVSGKKPDDASTINRVVSYLNRKTNSNYREQTPATQRLIRARLKEGFRPDDFKTVIDNMQRVWHGTEQEIYLRPQTLFGTKFESYLNMNGKIHTNEKAEWEKYLD